jgi:hypothetical protein
MTPLFQSPLHVNITLEGNLYIWFQGIVAAWRSHWKVQSSKKRAKPSDN